MTDSIPPSRDKSPTLPDLLEAAMGQSHSDAPAVRWWYRHVWRRAAPIALRHLLAAALGALATWLSHPWWHHTP